jgi:hypothetical protein
MQLKPLLSGIGSVLNAAWVDRFRKRAIASLIVRRDERRRNQRDYAIRRTKIDDQDKQR